MSDTRTKNFDVADDLVQRIGLNAVSYTYISDAVGRVGHVTCSQERREGYYMREREENSHSFS